MLNQLFNQGGHSEEYKGKMRKKIKIDFKLFTVSFTNSTRVIHSIRFVPLYFWIEINYKIKVCFSTSQLWNIYVGLIKGGEVNILIFLLLIGQLFMLLKFDWLRISLFIYRSHSCWGAQRPKLSYYNFKVNW